MIRNNYADLVVGLAIVDTIMAHIERGGADSSINVQTLIAKVMGVIRSMVADRHLDFSDRSAEQDDSNQSTHRSRSKHGLWTARMLEDQTAYFEFNGFPGDDA